MPDEQPTQRTPSRRLHWVIIGALALTTVIASIGWFLSARDGRGLPPSCYTLEDETSIQFNADHGNNTERATFAVAEGDDEVMLGYWEEGHDEPHTLEAYAASLSFTLIEPLGDRRVVSASGGSIPRC